MDLKKSNARGDLQFGGRKTQSQIIYCLQGIRFWLYTLG